VKLGLGRTIVEFQAIIINRAIIAVKKKKRRRNIVSLMWLKVSHTWII